MEHPFLVEEYFPEHPTYPDLESSGEFFITPAAKQLPFAVDVNGSASLSGCRRARVSFSSSMGGRWEGQL